MATRPKSTVEFSKTLLDGVRDCRPEALDELIRSCRPRLVQFADRRLPRSLRRRVDPEDIVQNALLHFSVHLPRGVLRFANSHELWRVLRTIVRHKLGAERRRHAAAKRNMGTERHFATRDDDSGICLVEPVDPHLGPAESAIAKDELWAATDRMRAFHRELALLWLKGYSAREIALATRSKVRTIQRALAKIQRQFERQRERERERERKIDDYDHECHSQMTLLAAVVHVTQTRLASISFERPEIRTVRTQRFLDPVRPTRTAP